MEAIAELAPSTRYRRQIDGADFSLEANTEAAPKPGRFYVLRDGEVAMESDHFPEAAQAYQALCREYWTDRLQSEERGVRLASAWGLVGLEPTHKDANEVIKEDGTPADCQRLDQARRRSRFAKARGGRYGRK